MAKDMISVNLESNALQATRSLRRAWTLFPTFQQCAAHLWKNVPPVVDGIVQVVIATNGNELGSKINVNRKIEGGDVVR